ncbi:valine--tRNA ligase [Plakobranchus ocellatus]|uniref:Valine--tRNA ligase, mitochondrial n=1 Tax=Plakobranchus ocellatus TaxID=259542 RepID=A0AAV3Y176_9GAST|nr:valine--tRNA ligase [Plakobranchus ocellatus]
MSASWSKSAVLYRHCGIKLYLLGTRSRSVHCSNIPKITCNQLLEQVINRDMRLCSFSSLKKDCSVPLGKTHEPSEVEKDWYEWWVNQGYFKPSEKGYSKGSFSLLLPPPNVTGTLHLGHALTGAVQDAFVRWHRMRGHTTLWVPGTDHAGIGTHAVVERKLWREKRKTRHDLGRDQFVKEIWKWKLQHGDVINSQMRTLGLSLDWSREYFTMDENLSRAVNEAFCRLYEKGLIYRDKRMINWSCALQSSLSDIEVDNIKVEKPTLFQLPGQQEKIELGTISRFAYPVENSEEVIVVSTTRLETMLADTAVAVNPDDPRYSHLIGRNVVHPLIKGRLLPIIADDFVDMAFGTGAVKITPGHDHTDYEVSRRHNLPIIEMLTDDGTVISQLPLVGGMDRFQARSKVREALCLLGYYHGEHPHPTVIPLCSRSGDVVEPRLKEQWFLNCKDMAFAASEAVKSGRLSLIPDYNAKIWHEWMSNTRDWCLSRQLWWGHRIPVYTCVETGKQVCALSEEEAKEKLSKELGLNPREISVTQDEDVLDTWFSSSLLPFSAMGWPLESADLSQFFPQSLLETGQDILFFWVARMVMLSLELTGQLPFQKVLLHGLVRDAHGRKMSKSLGNVIDPLDVIRGISLEGLHKRLEQGNLDPAEILVAKEGQKKDFPNGISACGSDALRFTLCSYNVKNMDINFDVSHAESRKRFCNKIWQSFKFVQSKLEPDFKPLKSFELSGSEDATDMWILSRLSHMVHACETHFLSYDLHLVTSAVQQFWHQEFCDVYLEAIKPIFTPYKRDGRHSMAVRSILHLCTDTFLRAAAPFMPFLCEELYQRLPAEKEDRAPSVCVATYPQPQQYTWGDSAVDLSMDITRQIVQHILSQRKDYNMMGSKSAVHIQTDDTEVLEAVQQHRTCLLALSRSGTLSVLPQSESGPIGCSSAVINANTSVFVELKGGTLDIGKELERLNKRKKKLEESRLLLNGQLEKMVAKGRGENTKAVKLREKLTSVVEEEDKISVREATLKRARTS